MIRLHPYLALGCLLLAAGLAINSCLGPLLAGIIEYRYTETYRNQGIGLDAFALLIAAPLLAWAGALAWRHHTAAAFIALGPALMAAYMIPQYILGAHYLEIEGNNEDFFLLHLGLFVLSVGVAVLAWLSADRSDLPPASRPFQRWTAFLLFAVAGFLILRYVPFLLEVWRGEPSDEYVADPIALWLIAFLDLGVVMPAAIACGYALLAGMDAARKAMYAIVGWFALVGPAVASMGVAMVVNDDAHASAAGTIVFAVYGLAFALLAAWLMRPLFKAEVQQHEAAKPAETPG